MFLVYDFSMKKIYFIVLSFLVTTSLFANEHYVYKVSILKVFRAKIIIDVEPRTFNNLPALSVKSNSQIRFMGKEIANLDYLAFNDAITFEPQINIECEHSENQSTKNCRSVKFLQEGQFLYKNSHNNRTVLEDLKFGEPEVVLEEVLAQQPTYNPNEHKIFDIASIVLLIKYLDINKDHRDLDLFIAVNRQMTKVKISYVQDIDANKMWIKMTPIWPGPEEYKGDFPHKIIYDRRIKTVTEVHKKLPYIGDVVIRLDEKLSSIGKGALK